MNDHISKALTSWYKPENDLYRNPEPAILGLAGECGELIDYYKKGKYKPNREFNTIMALDELGDIWWYFRITTWLYDYDLQDIMEASKHINTQNEMVSLLAIMNSKAAKVMLDSVGNKKPNHIDFVIFYCALNSTAEELGYDIDQLTYQNYQKLSSNGQHGWAKSR